MPSVIGFIELPTILVSELGCHVGIHFKKVRFELHIYIYILYIYILHIYIG